ncbi:MAG TPA: hypothetical protein VFB32_05390 [Rudaea sp.]|nr:hypothetical protein [Rudaea sp.]
MFRRTILAAALLVGASAAHAQFVQCNGCTTQQYVSLAESLGATQGTGNKYIADFIHHVATEWKVTREPNGRGFTYYADEVPMSAAYMEGFKDYDALYKATSGGTQSIVYVVGSARPDGFPKGIDSANGGTGSTALDWANQGYVGQLTYWMAWMQANSTHLDWIPPGVSLVLTAMQNGISVQAWKNTLQVVVQLKNGGIVTMEWDGTIPGKLIHAVDQFGNTIPLTKAQVHGQQYNFGGGADGQRYARNFGEYLQGFGIPVTYTTGGSIVAITCTESECIVRVE